MTLAISGRRPRLLPMACALSAVLVVLGPLPAQAGRWRRGLVVKLVEYSTPDLARRGTLTEMVYSGNPAPPYGYGYAVRVKVGGICKRPGVLLAGGRAKGWVSGYDYGDPGTFPEDLYADAVAMVPYGYDPADGSFGTDTPCGGGGEPRHGTLYIYRRASDYWWVDRGYHHVIDLHYCSDELGCQWYAGYVRNIPQGGVGPLRMK